MFLISVSHGILDMPSTETRDVFLDNFSEIRAVSRNYLEEKTHLPYLMIIRKRKMNTFSAH